MPPSKKKSGPAGSREGAPRRQPDGPEAVSERGPGSFPSSRGFKKKDIVLSHLRQEILGQNLKPGTVITAKGLSEQWGISRTPIRAAIDILVAEGLLTRKAAGEKATVREFHGAELFELLTLRYAIETAVAQRLACKKNPFILGKLDEVVDKLDRALEDETVGGWEGHYELDTELHVTMARLADMPTAAAWISDIMNQFRLYSMDNRSVASIVSAEHHDIVARIREFDQKQKEDGFDAIREAVKKHMKGTAERWAAGGLENLIEAEWE